MVTPLIKRVSLMAEDRARAIKMEIGEGEMRISSECCGIWLRPEKPSRSRMTETESRRWASTLHIYDFFHAIEEEEVLFEFKDGKTPAQINVHTADQDRFVEIVMPLLLS